MSKKRNCRRTQEEICIHEEAVKLRKMTDAQLVEKIHSTASKDHSANSVSVAEFIEAIDNADIAGIGKVTKKKIHAFAEDNGYI